MALATDANINKLQQMFPKVEGDVIALILNTNDNNVEDCIESLLVLSGEDPKERPSLPRHTNSGPAPKQAWSKGGHRANPSHTSSSSRQHSERRGGGRASEKTDSHLHNSQPPRKKSSHTVHPPNHNSVNGQSTSQGPRQHVAVSQPVSQTQLNKGDPKFPPGPSPGRSSPHNPPGGSQTGGPQGRGSGYSEKPHPHKKEEQAADPQDQQAKGKVSSGSSSSGGGGGGGGQPKKNYPNPGGGAKPSLLPTPLPPHLSLAGGILAPAYPVLPPLPHPPHLPYLPPPPPQFYADSSGLARPQWMGPTPFHQGPLYGTRADKTGIVPGVAGGPRLPPQLVDQRQPKATNTHQPLPPPHPHPLPMRPPPSMGVGEPHTSNVQQSMQPPPPVPSVAGSVGGRTSGTDINDFKREYVAGGNMEWPVKTVSESGTNSGNLTKQNNGNVVTPFVNSTVVSNHSNKHSGPERAELGLAGREWGRWGEGGEEGTSPGNKKLIILRGLPGSGKSTLARQLAGSNGIICSTDDFFYLGGRYVFDRRKLGEYHDKNKEKVREAMLAERSPVIVDNTNTTAWEMKPYVNMAQSFRYQVEIREPDTPWRFNCEELARRCSHDVPLEQIGKMLDRYQHSVTIETILASQPPERERGYQAMRPHNSTYTVHRTKPVHDPLSSSRPYTAWRPPPVNPPRSQNPMSYPHRPLPSSSSSPSLKSAPPFSPPGHTNQTFANSTAPAKSLLLPKSHVTTAPSSSSSSLFSPSNSSPNLSEVAASHGRLDTAANPPQLSGVPVENQKRDENAGTIGCKPVGAVGEKTKRTLFVNDPLGTRESVPEGLPPSSTLTPHSSTLTSHSNTLTPHSNTLILPPRGQAEKEEEEMKQALMSKIWGVGGWPGASPPGLPSVQGEGGGQGSIWSKPMWGGEGQLSSAVGEGVAKEEGRVGSSWGQHPPSLPDAVSTMWSGPVGLEGEERHSTLTPIQEDGLVDSACPAPCKFGAIGKPIKAASHFGTDTGGSGIPLQALVTNGLPPVDRSEGDTTASTVPSNPVLPGSVIAPLPPLPGTQTPQPPGAQSEGARQAKPPKEKCAVTSPSAHSHSASAEVWVSEETDSWAYDGTPDHTHSQPPSLSNEPSIRHSSTSTTVSAPANRPLSSPPGPQKTSPAKSNSSALMSSESTYTEGHSVRTHSTTTSDLSSNSSIDDPATLHSPALHCNDETSSKEPRGHSSPLALRQEMNDEEEEEEEEEEGQQKDGDFFPSAFESDKTLEGFDGSLLPLLQVTPVQHGLPIGDKDTRDKSHDLLPTDGDQRERPGLVSENAEMKLPVNCVPVVTASDDSKAVPTAWPNLLGGEEEEEEEGGEMEGNDVFTVTNSKGPSAGSVVVQESCLGEGTYQSYLSSREGATAGDRGKKGSSSLKEVKEVVETCGGKEQAAGGSDLSFLTDCFPELSEHYLSILYRKCQGNMEEVVSTALLSSITSPPPQTGMMDVFLYSMEGSDRPLSASVSYLQVDQVRQQTRDKLSLHSSSYYSTNASSFASVTSESEQSDEDLQELGLEASPSELSDDLNTSFTVLEDECVNDEEIARILQDQLNLADSDDASLQAVKRIMEEEEERQAERERRLEEAERTLLAAEDDDNLILRLSRSLASQLQDMFGPVEEHLPSKEGLRDEDLKVLLSERAAQLIWQNFNFSATIRQLGKEVAHESTDGNKPSQTRKSSSTSYARTAKKPSRDGGTSAKNVSSTTASKKKKKKKKTRAKREVKGLRQDDNVAENTFQNPQSAPSYDDLRAEAALHAKLRSEAFQKAARARSLKQGEVAFFYAQQGHAHTEMMHEANRRAADLILHLQNDFSSKFLDLHGLHVDEAIAALQDRLCNTKDAYVHVITGKGIHSKGREARIRPAVIQFLKSKNYSYEEPNAGTVKIKLK